MFAQTRFALIALLAAAGAATAQPAATAPADPPMSTVGQWLRRAQDDLQFVRDAREQSMLSWEIVRVLIRADDLESAETLGKLLFVRPHRWYYQEVLAGELARLGKFDQARKALAGIADKEERAQAQIEIIQALALAKQVEPAGELADQFVKDGPWAAWRTRAWGEIAAAQARNGNYAAACAIADGEAAKPIRDKILTAIATMQALAGDPAGAKETAAKIGEQIARDLASVEIDDSKSEAAFLKAWNQLPPEVRRWPLPPAEALEKGYRGLLLEDLAKALTSAKDSPEYNKALASASGTTERVVQPAPRPRAPRDPRRPAANPNYDPTAADQTIVQRAMGYTCIAMVEAAKGDLPGAEAMARRAIETAAANPRDNVFTGACGPILAGMLVRIGRIEADPKNPQLISALEYAGKTRDRQYGPAVSRALAYALAERNRQKELLAYLESLAPTKTPEDAENDVRASHRVNVCIGVATQHVDARKAGK